MTHVQLEWKEFNVDLRGIKEHMETYYPSFQGMTADYNLKVYFSEELSAEEQESIKQYWQNLTDDGNYVSQQDMVRCMDMAKTDASLRLWDDMTEQQRKIIMSLPLSKADEDQLLIDFPIGGA